MIRINHVFPTAVFFANMFKIRKFSRSAHYSLMELESYYPSKIIIINKLEKYEGKTVKKARKKTKEVKEMFQKDNIGS